MVERVTEELYERLAEALDRLPMVFPGRHPTLRYGF